MLDNVRGFVVIAVPAPHSGTDKNDAQKHTKTHILLHFSGPPPTVMPGLDPGINGLNRDIHKEFRQWITGSSPVMTRKMEYT